MGFIDNLNSGQKSLIQSKDLIDSLNPLNDTDLIDKQLDNPVSGLIKDPISGVLNKTLKKINNLTSNVESKINKLAEDIVKSVDNKGRVELQGNIIVVTVKPADIEKVTKEKEKLDIKIRDINTNLNSLKKVLSTLKTIGNTINIVKKALDIQEILLNSNPISKATYTVFKKAIKLVFLKDMLKEYSNVLQSELKNNQDKLNNIIEKFRNLRISIKIQDSNNTIDESQAETEILSELLSENKSESTDSFSQEYETESGRTVIIRVEKYGTRELIAKAVDKFSGLLIAQTAPSFTSSSDDLVNELKNIIET